jgi:hypothetical protein
MPAANNWALKSEPWTVLSSLLADPSLSWSHAPFTAGVAAGIPERPGIYALCARPVATLGEGAPQLRTLLYVGKAERSIRSRFLYHLSHSAKPKVKAARQVYGSALEFHWTVVGPERCLELEPCFYDAFGPPCNEISPPRPFRGTLGEPRRVGASRPTTSKDRTPI